GKALRHPGGCLPHRMQNLRRELQFAQLHHLGAQVASHDLKNGFQIQETEVLEKLDDRLAAAGVLLHDLFQLQIVHQALLLNQRQYWNRRNLGHTSELIMMCPIGRPPPPVSHFEVPAASPEWSSGLEPW